MRHSSETVLRVALIALLVLAVAPARSAGDTETPQPLVAAYDSLADTILGAKRTEWNLVHSILAATYSHAGATYGEIKMKAEQGRDARAEIEALAELVGQLGNEGDAAVAAVRKRLLEGGHHHHSGGEPAGIYDRGFVIVTRAARKVFLDAANTIGKQGAKADMGVLESEWKKVQKQFEALHENVER
jgi:hypothetical protein